MSGMTIFFVLVILASTFFTILLNSLLSKIGKVERTQKEFEYRLTNGSEDLEVARESYNAAVVKYNESVNRFPGLLVAGLFGFATIHIEREDNL